MGHGWSEPGERIPDWRWPGPQPAPDFAMVPGIVARDILKHLDGNEFKVFFCLMSDAYQFGRSTAEMSLTVLQVRCDLARATVVRCLDRLFDIGLIDIPERRPIGANDPNCYRVLVTADSRYISRSSGSKSEPGPSSKSEPGVVQILNRVRRPSFLSIDKEGKEGTHTAKKWFTGQYACCESCGCRPCMCGEEVAR